MSVKRDKLKYWTNEERETYDRLLGSLDHAHNLREETHDPSLDEDIKDTRRAIKVFYRDVQKRVKTRRKLMHGIRHSRLVRQVQLAPPRKTNNLGLNTGDPIPGGIKYQKWLHRITRRQL